MSYFGSFQNSQWQTNGYPGGFGGNSGTARANFGLGRLFDSGASQDAGTGADALSGVDSSFAGGNSRFEELLARLSEQLIATLQAQSGSDATIAQPVAGVGDQPIMSLDNPAFLQGNIGWGPNDAQGNTILTSYSSNYFADDQTAQELAQQLGGTVVQHDLLEAGGETPGSPFHMPPANYIQLPNGRMVNAGTIASYLKNYANQPEMLDALLQTEITGRPTQIGQAAHSIQEMLAMPAES